MSDFDDLEDVFLFGDDTDTDGDGVVDMLDNCPEVANPSQDDLAGARFLRR